MKRFIYLLIAISVVSLVVSIPMMLFFTDTRAKIAKETTYLTEPLTADGKRIDYFQAFSQRNDPPGMKTDDNGFRLIVQAFGPPGSLEPELHGQYYEKLGLPATHTPTTPYLNAGEYISNYFDTNPGEFEKAKALYIELKIAEIQAEAPPEMAKRIAEVRNPTFFHYEPRILSGCILSLQQKHLAQFPIVTEWLLEVAPALEVVAEAVRKPVYAAPLVRLSDEKTLHDVIHTVSNATFHNALSQSLRLQASYRLEKGEIDGVIDNIITLRRLGRLMGKQGTVIDAMIGNGIAHTVFTIGPNENLEFPMNTEQIRRFLRELDDLPQGYEEAMILENERLITLDFIQSIMFSRERRELLSEHLGSSPLFSGASTSYIGSPISTGNKPAEFVKKIAGRLGYNWNIVLEEANRYYDHALDPTYPFPEYYYANHWSWWQTSFRSKELGFYFGKVNRFLPISWLSGVEQRFDCSNNLQRIVLAMLLYEREHGTLPPAFTVDTTGKPLHSWRVLLLPYLGERELYDNLRLDEPWDSEHNKQYHDTTIAVYQCPGDTAATGQANYSVIVGNDTPFGLDGQGRLAQDFGPYTILVTECNFKPWMKPDAEVTQADAESLTATVTFHGGAMNYGFLSGAVNFLSNTTSPDQFQKLLNGTAERVASY